MVVASGALENFIVDKYLVLLVLVVALLSGRASRGPPRLWPHMVTLLLMFVHVHLEAGVVRHDGTLSGEEHLGRPLGLLELHEHFQVVLRGTRRPSRHLEVNDVE